MKLETAKIELKSAKEEVHREAIIRDRENSPLLEARTRFDDQAFTILIKKN